MSPPKSDHTTRRSSTYDTAWAAAAHDVCVADLRGLQVQCPSCLRSGTLLSKWQPKTPIKPLFVVHLNGEGCFESCALNKAQGDDARRRVSLSPGDVVKTFQLGKPFVLFSGGKDSVCTLLYMTRLAREVGAQVTALHADTTAGLPEVAEYVKQVCEILEIPLVVVRPPEEYFSLAKRWGLPGFNSRWCCETLKIAPMRRFLASQDGPKVVYDGIRAAESNIRANYVPVWFHPSFRCLSMSPIFQWSDEQVAEYIASATDLPRNPTESLNTSGECWCGAYKSRSDFEALLKSHPDIFAKLVETEEAQGGKYTFLYEEGKQVPLRALLEQ